MQNLFRATLLLCSAALFPGCGDGTPASTPTTTGSQATNGAPAAAQEPTPPPAMAKTLLETLLERCDGHTVFLADPEGRSEFPFLASLREELLTRKIPVESPQKWHYQNYDYYLNRLIPTLRWKGKLLLVFDHRHEPLQTTFQKHFLSEHKILWQEVFAEATLMEVVNEFTADAQLIDLRPVSGRGSMVTGIAFPADGGTMFVSGKGGEVRWMSRTTKDNGYAVRLPAAEAGKAGVFTGGEAGLIGLALHPRYPAEAKVYLHYNWQHEDGKRAAYVSEWRVDLGEQPKKLTFTDERKLLEIPMVADNHNAGCLQFGPDGYLYVAVGDGEDGKWTIGRSPSNSWRGKILRLDVDHRDEGKQYAVPADNPFVGNADFPPETWAWGFRNPWRFNFVPDGRIVCGDIGEDVNEELTFVVRGKHHGWPYFEGAHVRNPLDRDLDLQPALLPYGRHSGMSVIAGQVYQGEQLPELKGKFVFADYLSGYVWAFTLPSTDTSLQIGEARTLTRTSLMITTMLAGPEGEIYFGAHTGEVLRMHRADGASAADADLGPADPTMARGLFANEFPTPPAPAASEAQIALGKRLFAEPRWSADGSRSCATCHDPARAGQDGAKVGLGTQRNTTTVWNASRQFAQFHDYRATTVEAAAIESLGAHLGNEAPAAAVARLAALPDYAAAFAAAFPGAEPAVGVENAGHALGAFLRRLTTKSRWEQFLDGDDKALTRDELVGLNTFLASGCTTCHQYRGLGGGMPQKLGLMKPWTGADRGRFTIDPTPGQEFFFKVPTLFHVADTAPYYHDGSMATLADAVRHMAEAQLNRQLSPVQVQSIVTFLGALSAEPPVALKQ